MFSKENHSDESSNYESDNEQERFNIIDTNERKYLYQSLSDVEQESYLTLDQAPQGMMSLGFSTCYAVIMRNSRSNNVGLAHVSFITEHDTGFFNEMMQEVSEIKSDVVITLARSQQTYTKQYLLECKHFGNHGDQTPETYFSQYDAQYLDFFQAHFPECKINADVLEMPHGCILINADGAIDLLEQYKANQIDMEPSIDPDTTSPERHASSPYTFMPTVREGGADKRGAPEDTPGDESEQVHQRKQRKHSF